MDSTEWMPGLDMSLCRGLAGPATPGGNIWYPPTGTAPMARPWEMGIAVMGTPGTPLGRGGAENMAGTVVKALELSVELTAFAKKSLTLLVGFSEVGVIPSMMG